MSRRRECPGPSHQQLRIQRVLQERAPQVVTYEELYAAIWPQDGARRLACLRQEVWMLRQWLGPECVATVPACGYVWLGQQA